MAHLLDLLISFLDSNFFIGLVTIAVGTAAFRIYRRQQHDSKRDAANVILLEIEGAEQQLQTIIGRQSPGSLVENVYLMKNHSWDKYRYIFVRDFDRNEWDKITDFYNKCLQYDTSVEYDSNQFASNVDKAQSHILGILANYASDYVKQVETNVAKEQDYKELYLKRKSAFLRSYGVEENSEGFAPPYFYGPRKPVNEAQSILETIETNLSLTSVGIKLKRMAENRNKWQVIKGLWRR